MNTTDIKQGEIGDCYLLSALSVIAHTRPELIQKIFHKTSRSYQENIGLYTVMFYRNRKPVIITIDDYFPQKKDVRNFSNKSLGFFPICLAWRNSEWCRGMAHAPGEGIRQNVR